ncbi:MAG: type II secretion system F family protein [Acidimicrobiales bacterium]|nr:type II secretion system F family protein [Acidimicrobiales bacterium]
MSTAVVIIGAALVACSVIVLVWALAGEKPISAVQENLSRSGNLGDSRQIALSASARTRLLDPFFAGIARFAKGLTGSGTAAKTQRKLELAGLHDTGWTVERMLVIRVFSLLIGSAIAFSILTGERDRNSILLAIIVFGIGYAAPTAWLDRKSDERQGLIERQLPDIIDQLSVSVEAGLGFDAAMARSAEGRSGPLAEELTRVLQDLQVGVPRQDALERMVERTDVPDLRQFVVSIRQSTKHGLPIARILNVQSQELRDKRRSRVEEKAASLPVKIVFPLVFCILPSLFVVVLGPAALNISESF